MTTSTCTLLLRRNVKERQHAPWLLSFPSADPRSQAPKSVRRVLYEPDERELTQEAVFFPAQNTTLRVCTIYLNLT